MGRNEIRLRRQMMNTGRIAQHRNYGEIMARHERELKLKRISRVVIYFLIIAFFVILFFIITRWEMRENSKEASPESISLTVVDRTGSAHYL
jgi:hypothetical protein